MATAAKEASKTFENPLTGISNALLGKTTEQKASLARTTGLTGFSAFLAQHFGLFTPGLAAGNQLGIMAGAAGKMGMGMAIPWIATNPLLAGAAAFAAGGYVINRLIKSFSPKK